MIEVELAPKIYYIHYVKVYYLIIANKTNEVLNLIDDLVEKFPDFKYLLYDRKTITLFKAKRYEETLKIVDILIDFDLKNLDYLNNKAFILGYIARKEEAIATTEKLVQLNPKIGKSYGMYGEIYMVFGENENAIKKFEESLRIEPSSDYIFITILRMAYCYMKIKNYKKKMNTLKKGKILQKV